MTKEKDKAASIDEQLTFKERWQAVFPAGPGLIRPKKLYFNPNGSVELDICSWIDVNHFHNPRTFPDWKTVSDKDLADYYLDCCKLYVSTEFKRET